MYVVKLWGMHISALFIAPHSVSVLLLLVAHVFGHHYYSVWDIAVPTAVFCGIY